MNIYRGKTKKEVYLASQLYDSIDDHNLSAIKSLLFEKEANPNIIVPTKGISSFHLVIGSDDGEFALNVVRLILQNGGDPNVRSDDGLTPVHIAAAWGRLEILRMLLNSGGDPECKDSNWMTPVQYARKENFTDCVDLLRLYLPNNFDIFNGEKKDCYKLVLDKIVVNNGYVTGEYEIDSRNCNNNNTDDSITKGRLLELPKSDHTNLVLNWFDTHIDDRGGKTYIKNTNSIGISTDEDNFLSYESSVDESDNENKKKLNTMNITFRKAYKKKKKISKPDEKKIRASSSPVSAKSDHLSPSSGCGTIPNSPVRKIEEFSNESGILTLPNSKESFSYKKSPDAAPNPKESSILDSRELAIFDSKNLETSSDYMTCSANSLLNRNIFAIDAGKSLLTSDDSCAEQSRFGCDNRTDDGGTTELSFVTVSEVYRYEDEDEGVVLYEKRMIKVSSECNGSIKTGSFSSKMSSLPDTLDYDPVTLRRELTLLGFNPGPITPITKRVYLKKLYQLRKQPLPAAVKQGTAATKRVYSAELEKTLKDPNWTSDLALYKSLESAVIDNFSKPNPSKKWREGNNKSSFTYLLLDPRKTDSLPCRAEIMDPKDVWETFLSAVFYVGKGKRTRPYSHLYEALNVWKETDSKDLSKKIQTILDIWRNGSGVVCLHVFQNIIPVEAYTREACMISALRVENLSNRKGGDYYGVAYSWRGRQQRMLGSYLLHKAMMIFLNEGERQLYPEDIN